MSYTNITIKQALKYVNENKVFLPAIQRKFVWNREKIENLFDSLMEGYPIGTFIWWKLKPSKAHDYTFYKFLGEYHDRDKVFNDKAQNNLFMGDNIWGVMDGQQRMSAFYLGLTGTYTYKKGKGHWKNDRSFNKCKLYLNLFSSKDENDEFQNAYQFKFLTEEEAKTVSENILWFEVGLSLRWEDASKIMTGVDILFSELKVSLKDNIDLYNKLELKKSQILGLLNILYNRLCVEGRFSYFEVADRELDEVLEVFVRINSGGVPLDKTDLMFSTIIASWEKGREEVEELIKEVKRKGIDLGSDNIMRACLTLTDAPVLFKVKSFGSENVEAIKSNWNDIKNAIVKTIDIAVELGFSYENLTTKNALLPIAYFIYKGGDFNNSKADIRKYLVVAMLKQIFGGQGDQVISKIRDGLRFGNKVKIQTTKGEKEITNYTLKQNNFNYASITNIKLPSQKSWTIEDDTLEGFIESTKGPFAFMVLSLLYPNLNFSNSKYEMDHIHPDYGFGSGTDTPITKLNLTADQAKDWRVKKDLVPNLQLITDIKNNTKNKKAFEEWLNSEESKTPGSKIRLVNDHYIPSTSLDFSNFELFYEKRKQLIKTKLKLELNIQ